VRYLEERDEKNILKHRADFLETRLAETRDRIRKLEEEN
jgi:hypothetical protein